MTEIEERQYFLENPQHYSLIRDSELIEFLKNLASQAMTKDEVFFTYKKNAERIFQASIEMGFIEKIMVAGKQRYFLTQKAKLFLQECERLKGEFGMFKQEG